MDITSGYWNCRDFSRTGSKFSNWLKLVRINSLGIAVSASNKIGNLMIVSSSCIIEMLQFLKCWYAFSILSIMLNDSIAPKRGCPPQQDRTISGQNLTELLCDSGLVKGWFYGRKPGGMSPCSTSRRSRITTPNSPNWTFHYSQFTEPDLPSFNLDIRIAHAGSSRGVRSLGLSEAVLQRLSGSLSSDYTENKENERGLILRPKVSPLK